MMRSYLFTKMHGLGNDFVVFDARVDETIVSLISEQTVKWLCDRRMGVGADGVLIIRSTPNANAQMDIWNADGSRSGMCGNGLRCVVRYCVDRSSNQQPQQTYTVQVGDQIYPCIAQRDSLLGNVDRIELSMGLPRFHRADIPMQGDPFGEVVGISVKIGNQKLQMCAVSMGNPHVVFWGLLSNEVEQYARTEGPAWERSPLFPQRVNVGFASQTGPASIQLAVWERGSGFTQACGSGACAAVVSGVKMGFLPNDTWVNVSLPGGVLQVKVQLDGVLLRGPATSVFQGSVDLPTD